MTDTFPADATPATDAEAIIRALEEAEPVHELFYFDEDGKALLTHVYDRRGQQVGEVNEEQLRDRPRSRRGTVQVHTPAALVAYASRHVDQYASTLWGDVDARKVTVVLNDHSDHESDNAPGWADHQAVLQLKASPEWKAWTSINDQWIGQVELAEFLEENINAIVEPDGATMLEVAQTFQATVGSVFKRSQSLHSGEQQLVYEQDVNAKAGASGTAEIPREFVVGLRPFVGTDPVRVDGRFRFRLREGHLTLSVKLLNLDDVLREAVAQVLERVSSQLDLAAIEGAAPAPRRSR